MGFAVGGRHKPTILIDNWDCHMDHFGGCSHATSVAVGRHFTGFCNLNCLGFQLTAEVMHRSFHLRFPHGVSKRSGVVLQFGSGHWSLVTE